MASASLLADAAAYPDFAEQHPEDERALHELLHLHPMLSMTASNQSVLETAIPLIQRHATRVMNAPVVGKSHDDAFLRPPNESQGERPCAAGKDCVCVTMARLRHGRDTPLAFVCTEYLLPVESEAFKETRTLPAKHRRCLVCIRFWNTYAYVRARTDCAFDLRCIEGAAALDTARVDVDSLALAASPVNVQDGYRTHAMLFVDENYANVSKTVREHPMNAFLWHPIVRFCSTHYKYVTDGGPEGRPRIVQVGIGVDDHVGSLSRPHFGQPSVIWGRSPAAK